MIRNRGYIFFVHLNHPLLYLLSVCLISAGPLVSSFHPRQRLSHFDTSKTGHIAMPLLQNTVKNTDRCESENIINDCGSLDPHDLNGSLCNSIESTDTNNSLHRRRTLYLIRHGEAEHNVLEAKAQKNAKEVAEKLNLTPEETLERMEDARKSVLNDVSLRDAPLTDRGRQQAKDAAKQLREMVASTEIHHPTEAMCSPLSRCLETCKILLEDSDLKAHVRPEIAERRTQLPPDKPKTVDQLLRYTRENDRFSIVNLEQLRPETVRDEAVVRESKEMLRERANEMFDLLMECEHRHVLVVSHKGFLRELERGLLEMPESPLFDNCEVRVYRVIFTTGARELFHLERIA